MYIFTIDTPPGCPVGSTDPGETIEFEFLGFRCDHLYLKQLEPKNSSKKAKIHKKCLFLSSFGVLETVTKKMTLAFWSVERLILIFHKICINYDKLTSFQALKWIISRFCTYLETRDTGKIVKEYFFQFYHFCKKKLSK